MKKLIVSCLFLILCFTSCSSREINGREQTFVEYVILNKYSKFNLEEHKKLIESQGLEATPQRVFKSQPLENFPGIRLENWFKAKKVGDQ